MCLSTVREQIAQGTFVIGTLERVWENSSLQTVKEREAVGVVSGFFDVQNLMVQSSRVPFTSKLLQEILHYGSIEKFVKYQAKCTSMSCQYGECSCYLSFHYVALLKKMRKHPSQLPLYEGIKVILSTSHE